jgi:hypothetical protein
MATAEEAAASSQLQALMASVMSGHYILDHDLAASSNLPDIDLDAEMALMEGGAGGADVDVDELALLAEGVGAERELQRDLSGSYQNEPPARRARLEAPQLVVDTALISEMETSRALALNKAQQAQVRVPTSRAPHPPVGDTPNALPCARPGPEMPRGT